MNKFEVIITTGYIDIDTIDKMTEKGWTFIVTVPAKLIHPHAAETDKATLFSKYEEVEMKDAPETCGNEPV